MLTASRTHAHISVVFPVTKNILYCQMSVDGWMVLAHQGLIMSDAIDVFLLNLHAWLTSAPLHPELLSLSSLKNLLGLQGLSFRTACLEEMGPAQNKILLRLHILVSVAMVF